MTSTHPSPEAIRQPTSAAGLRAAYGCVTFDALAKWLKEYWGVQLSRGGGPGSISRYKGAWKSGFIVSGNLPGHGYSMRRYPTLSRAAEATGYFKSHNEKGVPRSPSEDAAPSVPHTTENP